jgi:outer membrane protein TolC
MQRLFSVLPVALPLALLLALALAPPGTAADEAGADALTAEEVLAASSTHFPGILKALAERRAAEGLVTESLGAFDLVFKGEGLSWADGFYDGNKATGEVSRALRPYGAKVYSKYSLSRGKFPIYQDEFFTNRGGDLKLGVLFSLLKDRDIDQRRFREGDSRLALEQAELDLLLTRVGVQQQALVAYWEWVAAGQQLRVYEDLLAIALERERGLEREVQSGRRAEIFLTENGQNITRRQILVTTAERDFRGAGNRLAFFLRDEAGLPVVPAPSRLPQPGVVEIRASAAEVPPLDIPSTLERRPELRILATATERALRKVELSENALLPKLDLKLELSQPFGDIGTGGPSRDETDTIVGLAFSVPLERRAARGKLSQAEARLQALEAERRRLEDQVEIELRNILLELNVTLRLVQLAARDVELSETMRRAEVTRFKQGASDFFLVNIREETAANARVRYYDAYRRTRIARANYDAATVNLGRLGLRD